MDKDSSNAPRSGSISVLRWLVLVLGAIVLFVAGLLVALQALKQTARLGLSQGAAAALGILIVFATSLGFMLIGWGIWRLCRLGRLLVTMLTWRNARRALVGFAIIATLTAVFYAEENWRGRRAWESCKRELEAKGANFEWSAYTPTPIPDEQNIFKAPKMADWFVAKSWTTKGRWETSALTKRLGATSPSEFLHRADPVAEVTVVVPRDAAAAPAADVLLDYSGHLLSLATSDNSTRTSEKIPIIRIEDVSLSATCTNLARQMGLKLIFDPKVLAGWQDASGNSLEPTISMRWENVSAREALMDLLENHRLTLVEDPQTGSARVVPLNASGPLAILQPAAEERLQTLLQEALDRSVPVNAVPEMSDVRPRKFIAGPLPEIKTLRLTVFADRVPRAVEVEGFLPHSVKLGGRIGWRAVATGSNTFNLHFIEETYYSAAEFLAWSDQFAPEFETIREALRRPLAQISGDYQRPFSLPIPDFVCLRNLAQLLAERAQCYLLLGRPEQALGELTLLHDLHKLLDGKPTLLVAAMINVAITGLYTSIIADGFSLHAWREPELLALQKQLAEINLPPIVLAALRTEGAATSQTLLNLKPAEVIELFRFDQAKSSPWAKFTDPTYLLLKVAPRGWAYQNLVRAATLGQEVNFGTFDPQTGLVHPGKVAAGGQALEDAMKHWSPYTILARVALPNFSRAMQTAARNQTFVNEALIVCALERHRAARGEFPESLAALVPSFAETFPRDLFGGQPFHYRREPGAGFTLYSVGWNETDDGGRAATTTGPAVDYMKGDWVWQTPLK